jgi:hypothetical protein
MRSGGQAEIDLAAGHLTGLLERYMPGLLKSLNLVGSAADGDFRVGSSDLDFVAVLARPISGEEIEGLVIVHRLYAADMTLATLDGIWVSEAELAAGPDAIPDGPSTRSGQFLAAARGNRNPVTWFVLREQSRTIVGELDRAGIWYDPSRLMSWTRQNVDEYWAPWLARARRFLTRPGLAMLGPSAVMWGVLGISRLHHTLATGRIVSKSGAGDYALSAFEPRWHRIIEESLRIRRDEGGPRYGSPFARRRDALDFVAMAIEAIRNS